MSSCAVSSCMCFPKGFVRIRHFGFLAHRRRATLFAPLLSTTRSPITTADRTSSILRPATQPQPTLSLSPMWWPHGGHRETYGGPDPTPFSALDRRGRRMKPISQNRKPRSVFRLDPPSCALPRTKFLSMTQNRFQSRSLSTSINLCKPPRLFSHQAHCPIAYLMPPIDPIENPSPSARDRTAGRLPLSRCIKSDRRRF
jgi:hypothetical protein